VVLIIGITGACRRQELLNLKVNDVEDLGEFMKIMLPITKTKVPREFTVTKGHFKDLNLVDMVRICNTAPISYSSCHIFYKL
jgi:hypothetical protein